MITRYKLFLYRLFTIPTTEVIEGAVLNAFLAVSLLQTANIGSLLVFLMAVFKFDLHEMNRLLLMCIIAVPPLVVNYSIIYSGRGYKKILKDFGFERKGSLMDLIIYGGASILILLLAGFFFASMN